jgi:hypothetical protein
VHLSEVIGPSNPRAALFDAAKQKEIQGIIECGTWKVVLKEEMPENPNIMGGRFVLTIKDSDTSKEIYKARYVVQDFRDKKKISLVHDASTSKQQSTKLLGLGLAANSDSDSPRFLAIGFSQQTSLKHICKAQSR